MGYEAENEARKKAFADWCVDAEMMAAAKPDALFMHCLPAHRGEEVEADVIDGPQSVVWDEAENRMHVQKALMEYLLLGRVDAAVQAMAGLMSINGDADGDPLRVGLPVVDMVTGMNAVIGVLLALHERGRSGQGQLVDAALYDSGLSLLHPHAPNWFMSGKIPQRTDG